MGLPDINISFRKKANDVIRRSERGTVLLLLNDSTKETVVNAYNSFEDVVKLDYNEKNYLYIKLAFLGKPQKVIAVRGILNTGNLDINASKALIENLDYDWAAVPGISESDKVSFAAWFDTNKKTKYKKA